MPQVRRLRVEQWPGVRGLAGKLWLDTAGPLESSIQVKDVVEASSTGSTEAFSASAHVCHIVHLVHVHAPRHALRIMDFPPPPAPVWPTGQPPPPAPTARSSEDGRSGNSYRRCLANSCLVLSCACTVKRGLRCATSLCIHGSAAELAAAQDSRMCSRDAHGLAAEV